MSRSSDSDIVRPSSAGPARGADRWARLLQSDSAADALVEIAGWFDGALLALALQDDRSRTVGAWGTDPDDSLHDAELVATVPGSPDWRLRARFAPGRQPGEAPLAAAVSAMEAWRAAHGERARLEARLARRTRELDLIQTLGRRAAEAATPFELFRSAVAVLHQGEDLDLVMAAHSLDGAPDAAAFLCRPVDDEVLYALARRAGGLLGWPADGLAEPVRHRLDTFADDEIVRRRIDDHDLVVLPIVRRRTTVACLLVVPSGPDGDGALRLLYSATNQLAIHLDRILTVREAEADRFRSTLDSMPQAVLLTDGRLRIQLANRTAERMFSDLGLPIAGDLGEAVSRLGLDAAVDRVRLGRTPVADADVALDGDRTLHVTVSPLAGKAAAGGGLVLVWADVTESRRLQRRLAQSEKMSSLGQMISGVAHELNNPLASILGYAQLLRGASPDDRSRARLDTLRTEAERCRRIVQNLLSFARRRDPERTAVSINEVVQSVVALMGYQLRVDGVRIVTELASDVPALRGDVHELQQVLVNMLTNARHAIGDEGGEVVIRTHLDGDDVCLDLFDDGPGVPAAIRGRIFDPFFTTKPEGSGTGLGLSLVYGIVENHGGTIDLLDGAGARFRVRLPVHSRGGATSSPSAETPELSKETPRGRILVVDDEEPLARMICDALAEIGHEVNPVHDGKSALECIAETSFDLIISDVKMPGMNGERLLDEVRRRRPELVDRLLLTTGDTISDESETLERRTGLPVLRKPFDLDELQRVVATRLRSPGGDG